MKPDVNQLAERFSAAWEDANGVSGSRVEVLTGQSCFAILIEGAFTEAERLLAKRDREDNPLRRYLTGLMEVIGQEAISPEARIAERRVHSLGTDINFEQGWVIWYFRLGDPHPPA